MRESCSWTDPIRASVASRSSPCSRSWRASSRSWRSSSSRRGIGVIDVLLADLVRHVLDPLRHPLGRFARRAPLLEEIVLWVRPRDEEEGHRDPGAGDDQRPSRQPRPKRQPQVDLVQPCPGIGQLPRLERILRLVGRQARAPCRDADACRAPRPRGARPRRATDGGARTSTSQTTSASRRRRPGSTGQPPAGRRGQAAGWPPTASTAAATTSSPDRTARRHQRRRRRRAGVAVRRGRGRRRPRSATEPVGHESGSSQIMDRPARPHRRRLRCRRRRRSRRRPAAPERPAHAGRHHEAHRRERQEAAKITKVIDHARPPVPGAAATPHPLATGSAEVVDGLSQTAPTHSILAAVEADGLADAAAYSAR